MRVELLQCIFHRISTKHSQGYPFARHGRSNTNNSCKKQGHCAPDTHGILRQRARGTIRETLRAVRTPASREKSCRLNRLYTVNPARVRNPRAVKLPSKGTQERRSFKFRSWPCPTSPKGIPTGLRCTIPTPTPMPWSARSDSWKLHLQSPRSSRACVYRSCHAIPTFETNIMRSKSVSPRSVLSHQPCQAHAHGDNRLDS